VLQHDAGRITAFEWDLWHQEHREDWMGDAEVWAAEAVAADRLQGAA
jgi:hypothetical protein